MIRRAFIPMAAPVLGDRETEYVLDALRSGWISSQGSYVTAFEEAFAARCGVHFGVSVTSGTTALHLALVALGVGPGDEVILPALTHIAVANAVTLTGARPVLVDSEPDTWNLDPAQIAAKLTPRTKAIIAVHLYGHPVDTDALLALARPRGISLIEDAAEAHGARNRGRPAGSLGDLACFSFYANKLMTTGEGGMVVTSDEVLAQRLAKLHDQAYEPERRFLHRELGFNYRLTNLQAAIGLAQLERLDEFVAIRRRNAALYDSLLTGIDCLALPVERAWATNVYWMYSVVLTGALSGRREAVAAALTEKGIDSRPFFYPVHQQPLYAASFAGERYPVTERLAEDGLNLPSGNELTEEEVRYVASMLHTILSSVG